MLSNQKRENPVFVEDEGPNYEAAFAKIKMICTEVAKGNLNVRFNNRQEFGEEIGQVFSAINQLLDQTDAFVRESGATLEHASRGKFYRRFIERGMLGDFKRGAAITNLARNYMIKLEASRKEEMGKLASNLEREVKSVVDVVRQNSEAMQIKSEEMSTDLEGVTEQARNVVDMSNEATDNVESCAAAVEEMAASAQEISRQSDLSRMAAGKAAEEIASTNEIVEGLGKEAEEIGEITKIINDIASRTNLLALNATIESARAGEAGRGFAVVASEVKNLAGQTAEATSRVDRQISTIQEIAARTADAVVKIGTVLHKSGEISNAVASAAEEQRTATQEISHNVQSAANATRTSATSVSEVAGKTSQSSMTAKTLAVDAVQVSDASLQLAERVNVLLGSLRSQKEFNRRDSERYESLPSIECNIMWDRMSHTGRLKNVSRTGAAIDAALSVVEGNELSFMPKGWTKPIKAEVRGNENDIVRVEFKKGQRELIIKLIKMVRF